MTVDEFVARVPHAKKGGQGWVARCPAHDDKKRSLSISEGDDGKTLVKCFAGCSAADIAHAAGCEIKDLFADDRADFNLTPAGRQNGSQRVTGASWDERIEATYDYVDAAGALLFQSVRLRDPKDFRQRRPDGDGWTWKLGDTRRVLYQLPGVVAAVEAGRSVWLPEGEKDADALCELGFTATTNPMGASSWSDEYAESLKGAPWVLVLADCDEPGRKAAQARARSLHAQGIPTKVIDLAPERDDGYDVSDYIVEHGEEEAAKLLREFARTTPRWSPVANASLDIPIMDVGTFLAGVPTYETSKDYLGPFLHGGYRVHVAGPIGHGKTSFLMEAVSAAVRGEEFLGWPGRGNLRALYVDLEMGMETLGQAIRDARLDQAPKGAFQLLHYPNGLQIDTNHQHRKILERAVAGYEVVVLDPWYKLLENELENSSVRAVLALLDGLRAKHPALCMLVGFHAQQPLTPKARIDMGSISGFKVFQRPADIVLTFQRMGGDTSRIRWVKNRSPRLPVKMDEVWTVEWERGRGFHLSDEKSARDQVLEILSDDWQGTSLIAEAWGRSRKFTSDTLNRLALEGLVDSRGSDVGGRAGKTWRLHDDRQEAFDVAV